jgi:dTDP-4-amino-4,6-dideoxygalactose transaminase
MIAEVSCSHLDTSIRKVETRSLTVGIAGLGYVGLPLAQLFTPLAIRQQECFRRLGLSQANCPVSELVAGRVIAIPIYPQLTSDARLSVADVVATALS